jgi:hypothetical protein
MCGYIENPDGKLTSDAQEKGSVLFLFAYMLQTVAFFSWQSFAAGG